MIDRLHLKRAAVVAHPCLHPRAKPQPCSLPAGSTCRLPLLCAHLSIAYHDSETIDFPSCGAYFDLVHTSQGCDTPKPPFNVGSRWGETAILLMVLCTPLLQNTAPNTHILSGPTLSTHLCPLVARGCPCFTHRQAVIVAHTPSNKLLSVPGPPCLWFQALDLHPREYWWPLRRPSSVTPWP